MSRCSVISEKLSYSSMVLLFYHLPLQQNNALVTSLCILVGKEVNTMAMRVPLPVTKKKGGEKGKNASALGWKTDTNIGVLFKHEYKNRTAY